MMYTQMKFPLGKEKGKIEQNAYYCTSLQNVCFMLSAKNKHKKMSVSYLLKCFHLLNVAQGVIKIATE